MGWFSRAALEYIGQGGMGYSFDSLDANKKNVYGDAIKMFMLATPSVSYQLQVIN